MNYRKNLIDKVSNVLFENKIKNTNKYFGRDKYSNSVIVESNDNLAGKIKNVKISDVNHNTLFGKIPRDLNQTNYAA
jgi:tRNA A37 methylthiotransferase MiaB